MNKLLVQIDNNKFVNNIQYTQCRDIAIAVADTNNNLYEINYNHNFNAIIFMASNFNTEIFQFINEYCKNIKIFIYHNTLNQQLFDLSKQYNIKQIVPNIYRSLYSKSKNIYLEPILVNDFLYRAVGLVSKTKNIVSFIDHIDSLPKTLLDYLYPNTKLPIKLFNNPNIKHHQNIGLLNEQEKSKILLSSEYFLSIEGYYATEANLCGCKVIDISELDDLKPNKYKTRKEYQTYSNYIEKFIYD